jgi:hypothetical protein
MRIRTGLVVGDGEHGGDAAGSDNRDIAAPPHLELRKIEQASENRERKARGMHSLSSSRGDYGQLAGWWAAAVYVTRGWRSAPPAEWRRRSFPRCVRGSRRLR